MALAFAIYQSGGALWRLRWPSQIVCFDTPDTLFLCTAFWQKLEVACVQGALALFLHEGAHALVARAQGIELFVVPARGWRAWAILAAAAGVYIVGPTLQWHAPGARRSLNPAIALAGIGASLAAAAFWFAILSAIIVFTVAVPPWFPYFGYAGFRINALLGLSGLLPLAGFDGEHLIRARPYLYGLLAGAALILVFALGNEHVLQWLLQAINAL
jgi:Zn-dependent protease